MNILIKYGIIRNEKRKRRKIGERIIRNVDL
jgi:hypothetical protein